MRHRERESVGGVGCRRRRQRKDDADHLRDLSFVRAAMCRNDTFDARRRVLVNLERCATTYEECDTSRVAELGRGLRVLVEEDRLDARVRRRVRRDDVVQCFFERGEAKGKGTITERDDAVRDVNETRAATRDDAPTELSRPGVQPEDDGFFHAPSRARSSSEMSKSE